MFFQKSVFRRYCFEGSFSMDESDRGSTIGSFSMDELERVEEHNELCF
jgi:hypothetical protein